MTWTKLPTRVPTAIRHIRVQLDDWEDQGERTKQAHFVIQPIDQSGTAFDNLLGDLFERLPPEKEQMVQAFMDWIRQEVETKLLQGDSQV